LTDIGSVSGCVKFIQECKKKEIKPILGAELIIKEFGRITVLCKNKTAWTQLLSVISVCNNPENYIDEPSISMNELVDLIDGSNFVCIDGYIGSGLFNSVFTDHECIIQAADLEECMSCIDEETVERSLSYIGKIKQVFSDYFLEIDNIDKLPVTSVMSEIIYRIDPDFEFTIPESSSFYPDRKDSLDHRLLLCVKLKTTMKKLESKINDLNDFNMLKFIRSSSYYIKSPVEIETSYRSHVIRNVGVILDMIEDFNILSNPKLPDFQCPDGMEQNDYLKHLCRQGWKKLLKDLPPEKINTYKDRVLKELGVIEKANLAGYFLIVQDYVNHFRDLGYLIGPARGSGGGSLVCYLIGITLIDPIPHDLIFERFFNVGRYSSDNISFSEFSYKDFISNGV